VVAESFNPPARTAHVSRRSDINKGVKKTGAKPEHQQRSDKRNIPDMAVAGLRTSLSLARLNTAG
jgi:hypothetical protein